MLGLIGVSYAWWSGNAVQESINKVDSSCLEITLEDDTIDKAISLENAYPLRDEEARETKPYKFTIKNNCTTAVNYTVNLAVLKDKTNTGKNLDSKYIDTSISTDEKDFHKQKLSALKSATLSYKDNSYDIEGKELESGILSGNDSIAYYLRLWIDEETEATSETINKSFRSKIVVEAVLNAMALYKESILHGADPVLEATSKPVAMLMSNEIADPTPTVADQLIPVKIDKDTGAVTKADLYEEWYDYETQQWANAVILKDPTKTYENNEEIPEDDIESYFVWIPRYRYKLFNTGNYPSLSAIDANSRQTIEIEFETKDEPKSEGDEVGEWLTHPAFTAFDTNGIWVGKFETGYDGAANTAGAQQNVTDVTKVIVKPNVYSWRNITVGNAFKTAKNYEPTLQSHMMKNTEWGAVAYLQHSKYGSRQSVRINNNSNYVTGYAAKNEPTTGYTATNETGNKYEGVAPKTNGTYGYHYGDSNSKVASTTNNYTGIYDMSGGCWEYMASAMTNSNNPTSASEITFLNSGLTAGDITDLRFVDLYATGTETQYNRRILGDATGEMGPFVQATYGSQNRKIGSWYNDEAWFVDSASPWFFRGGSCHHGTGAGVFGFGPYTGGVYTDIGFRLVLAL